MSREGGFSISMPGTPREQTIPTSTPDGQVISKLVSAQADGIVCLVVYTDLPIVATDQAEVSALIDNARDGLLLQPGSKITAERPVSIDGHTGKEFQAESAGKVLTARIFLVKDRMYQVAISVPKGTPAGAAEAFLSSFKLVAS